MALPGLHFKYGIDTSLRMSLESSIQYTSNAIDARLPSAAYKNIGLNHRKKLEPAALS